MENKEHENQTKADIGEELIQPRKTTTEELCKKHGIPYRNTTMEHIGKTVIIPWCIPQKEGSEDKITDSWGAFARYANQRKGSGNK